MDDISKQVAKAMKELKRDVSRAAHDEVAKAAAPMLAALEREVGSVFENRAGKTGDELRAEVTSAATRADVGLDDGEIREIVSTILSGERPTFHPEIRITGLD